MIAREIYKRGHLTAKPEKVTTTNGIAAGLHSLNLDSNRDGLLYIPQSYNHKNFSSLAVMFHGAGGNAEHGLHLLQSYADQYNIILLAPFSRSYSWDIIATDSFGPDVIFIDQALHSAFHRLNVDPDHIAIGGFSDGASYALSLGLSNGDLFTHIIAFSPGFSYTLQTVGKPDVFISHGDDDKILPINSCSRRLVPQLCKKGYNVLYEEFKGEHTIPAPISSKAVNWFTTNNSVANG